MIPLFEEPREVNHIETESGRMVAGGRFMGNGELLRDGYRVTVWKEGENILCMDAGNGSTRV